MVSGNYKSVFDIIGPVMVGPSSSHTVGPMRAAKRYIDNLHQLGVFGAVSEINVRIYGSLALTGIGHGTSGKNSTG